METDTKYTDYWQVVIAEEKPFTDSEFPPTRDSLYDEFDFTDDGDISFYQKLKWKRASQLFERP